MKRWIRLLVTALTVGHSVACAQRAQHPGRTVGDSALAGVSTIRLRLNLNAQSRVSVPIDTALLMRTVVAKLTANGWTIATDADTTTHPIFLVAIQVFEYRTSKAPDTPIYITRYDYGVHERVQPPRHARPTLARTWTGVTWTDVADDVRAVQGEMLGTCGRIITALTAARGPTGRRADTTASPRPSDSRSDSSAGGPTHSQPTSPRP